MLVDSGSDHTVHGDVVVGAVALIVVGDHEALEAPLVAQHAGQQVVAVAGVQASDAGPAAGHHAIRGAHGLGGDRAVVVGDVLDGLHGFLHAGFERLEVDFANGLLSGPHRRNPPALLLLVDHGEVLERAVGALAAGTGDDVGRHLAGN